MPVARSVRLGFRHVIGCKSAMLIKRRPTDLMGRLRDSLLGAQQAPLTLERTAPSGAITPTRSVTDTPNPSTAKHDDRH